MAITTLSSRELNQDVGRAKKAAQQGPVFITDRGRPSHVLLSIAEYQRLLGTQDDFADRLGLPAGVENVGFDAPRSREMPQAPDFS